MSNVFPMFPDAAEADAIHRAAQLVAARWEIRYVAATAEYLVWDKTRRAHSGQAVVCADGPAVLRYVVNTLSDEAAR